MFFAACAGTLQPVPPSGNGAAGSFPLGCFDSQGNQLGADSFVPGYTEVYAFADGRTNANPVSNGIIVEGATLIGGGAEEAADGGGDAGADDGGVDGGADDGGIDGGADAGASGGIVVVKECPIPESTRLLNAGCNQADPFSTCTAYTVDVDVDAGIADHDDAGKPLEAVWVDYFAEQGDFDTPTLLVSNQVTGLTSTHSSKYIAPPQAGVVQLWAVLHDSRGGASVLTGFVTVE